ncbi:hypothetical protein HMPREF0762_01691 [Slackia exigua ATCC 700122]|uniref:Uncharacterized protein n=1 Tax=Slackia exigua (strain ATCC 700122 / DSM 15923 / CIP 105133 / JCM 11022 / KCTC 5966 / S-7) TaxID=649764 RepID=D0WIL6_SLAES|nr:hypothetical protein HMPREF0762_01691 [Slackia exigua ATCC 700122]
MRTACHLRRILRTRIFADDRANPAFRLQIDRGRSLYTSIRPHHALECICYASSNNAHAGERTERNACAACET